MLLQAIGALLIGLVLVDLILTVLYARAGTGIISVAVTRATWRLFLGASTLFGQRRVSVLALCGPATLLALLLAWAGLLICGAALIVQPGLGTAIQATSGETPTDWVTALYVGGSSMSIIGSSDFAPTTTGYRLLFLFDSLMGMTVLSLTLTYLMQVYSALHRRNSLGLKVHLLTAETGDAAELIARLGPLGQFSSGYTNLSDLASEMSQAKEGHHFYPVVFYFRFTETYYAVSRFSLVALDTVSLIRSALSDEHAAWLKQSASVEQLSRASLLLVKTLEHVFTPGAVEALPPPDDQTIQRWRARYVAAGRRLQRAGIPTVADEQAGADAYVSLRSEWDHLITALAPAMGYTADEIDPTGRCPEEALSASTHPRPTPVSTATPRA